MPLTPKKVCQVTAVDFTVKHFLAPLISALAQSGCEVTVCCADTGHTPATGDRNITYVEVPFERSLNLIHHFSAYRHILEVFRRERFDIVHVHTPVASVIARLAAARAGVGTIVYTAHGFYFHENMRWPARSVAIAVEWIAGRWTDILFTQSGEDADLALRLHLCKSGDVTAIGNGVDPLLFPPPRSPESRRTERIELGLPPDCTAIVMVGRLVVEKGYLDLLEAVAALDEVELWIVGERLSSDHAGEVEDALREYEQANEGARILRLGYRTDVAAILRCADIFCLPSHREGMPRSVIEAMMTGLPVVGTDIRGTREEVLHQVTGLLVPPSDPAALRSALNLLAVDKHLRTQMGAAGRTRAVELFDEAKVLRTQLDKLGL